MKKIFGIIMTLACSLCLSIPSFACDEQSNSSDSFMEVTYVQENGSEETIEYSIEDLSYDIVDEEGNIVESGDMGVQPFAYNVSASTVGVNKTIYWYPTNNKSGFKSGKNVAVKISLKTSAATSLTIGLTGNGTKKDVTNKNPSVSLVSGTSGYWKMFVKNTSSKSIKVTGGSISWNE